MLLPLPVHTTLAAHKNQQLAQPSAAIVQQFAATAEFQVRARLVSIVPIL
jgi:hypothetical protein